MLETMLSRYLPQHSGKGVLGYRGDRQLVEVNDPVPDPEQRGDLRGAPQLVFGEEHRAGGNGHAAVGQHIGGHGQQQCAVRPPL